jgi:hypothetical protein
MLPDASFTTCLSVWPVLTVASLSALLAPLSALMVLVEASSGLILPLDQNDRHPSVLCCSVSFSVSGMFFLHN